MANEKKAKGENILYNLGFNIIIPVLILTKYSDVNHLGALNGLIIALAFPLFYGLYDLIIRKKKNFISILGFISVLITGIIGIFEFPQEYIAYKELLIPSLIGTAVIASIWTPFPLVKKLFYNEEILNIARIEETLTASNSMPKLDSIMKTYSILLGITFYVSAIGHFIAAKIIIHSAPGTPEFSKEYGKLIMMRFPASLPSLVLVVLVFWLLIKSIKKITGITTDEIYAEKLREK